jgi:pimeloyl-ACP methyl ester carboxylesterase
VESPPRRRRWPRRLLIAGVLLAAAIALVWWSGNASPVDTVAAVERDLGIDLESSRVAAGEVQLHVVQAGPADGPPVVLLHGFPEFWFGWRHQIAPLARAGFRVIVPDQRGYAASDKPDDVASYRLDVLAGDVAALARSLGHERVFLAGHDWGGAVAWRVALDHPDLVRRLLIFNLPHPQAFDDAVQSGELRMRGYWLFFQLPWLPELANRAAGWSGLIAGLRNSARPEAFAAWEWDHYRWAWDRDGAMRTMLHWYRASFRAQPPALARRDVDVPVRVVLAPNDAFIDVATVRRSLGYCPHGTAVEIPNVGHWLLHEEPERTSREMVEFFSRDGQAETAAIPPW